MVDDSIVRGTTSMRIVEMLRHAGAREVYVLISSPPVISSCFYGIDTSSTRELIGSRLDVASIAKTIGANYLGYLSKDGMLDSIGLPRDGFCTACFTGCYPVEGEQGPGKYSFEEDDGGCGGCGIHI
jgi:amidophosphoribosyltransferase